jgi:hypothetical protein
VDDNMRIETLSTKMGGIESGGELRGEIACAQSMVLSFEAANNGRQRSPVETFRIQYTLRVIVSRPRAETFAPIQW